MRSRVLLTNIDCNVIGNGSYSAIVVIYRSNMYMRKYIVFTVFFVLSLCAKARTIDVQVNENVELMGILARMAGYPEYNMDLAGKYIKDIDAYFNGYSEHPAIKYMRKVRQSNSISYDAVMSMAIHLENRNGQFSLIEENVPTLEKRWMGVDKSDFLLYLNQFYKDTDFNRFFNDHHGFYEQGLESYRRNVMKHLDMDWYSGFYGNEPQETFSVIIGFCCGGGNYGVNRKIDGKKKDVYAIVGYYVDNNDLPMYNRDCLPLLVHEFNHSFINHLLDENRYPGHVKQLEQAATYLFRSSQWAMMRQAYGNWKTMINESLVRAAVICYMLDNKYKQEDVVNELLEQVQRNFRWMPELVALLRIYEKKRNRYVDLEEYYPRIINFFKDYANEENKRLNVLN